GADELFLGYNRYRVTAWNARLGGVWDAVTPAAAPAGGRRAVRRLPPRPRRHAARGFLALQPGPRGPFRANFALLPPPTQRRLLTTPHLLEARDPFAAALDAFVEGGQDLRQAMSRADLETYLVELLMKQDQMSMSASVESRVPFLDHRLVEYVAAMPA